MNMLMRMLPFFEQGPLFNAINTSLAFQRPEQLHGARCGYRYALLPQRSRGFPEGGPGELIFLCRAARNLVRGAVQLRRCPRLQRC